MPAMFNDISLPLSKLSEAYCAPKRFIKQSMQTAYHLEDHPK